MAPMSIYVEIYVIIMGSWHLKRGVVCGLWGSLLVSYRLLSRSIVSSSMVTMDMHSSLEGWADLEMP
jgi:hypothetical protein